MNPADAQEPVRICDVGKAYGPTVALDSVSIELFPGEIHALLGENGAGKSTLVKILSGVVRADSGAMRIGDEPYDPRGILDARGMGVATAFQELSLLRNLSIAENLMLPKMPKAGAGLVSHRKVAAVTRDILERHDLGHLQPDSPVAALSLSDRQRLEIVRAMVHATSLLILDEPTAALADVEWLFRLVRRQRAGGTAVLYISHRLAEVRSLCGRATVLRNGRSIGTVELEGASDADIFQMMVGRSIGEAAPPRAAVASDAPIALDVRGLTGDNLNDVSFSVRRGEIVGIAGLEGQGQRGLFRSLVGLAKIRAGTILVDGKPARMNSPADALKREGGLAYLPEDRKSEGILPGLSTASNMVLPIVSRLARLGLVWPARELSAARETAEDIDLAQRYLPFRIEELSGGNQQKAILARTVMTGARTLLLFDPTRGVDVGTKQSIYAAIRAFAEQGGAVLFYSSELAEIVNLADRCIVLYRGRVFAEYDGAAIDEQALLSAMIGHDAKAGAEAA